MKIIQKLLALALMSALFCSGASAQVRICVLDSGCDLPDISGWNFITDTADIADSIGHGTQICTLLNALAPDAECVMLKCFDSDMEAGTDSMERALYAAAEEYSADIILMCWTGTRDSESLHAAVCHAKDCGSVLLAPSGNLSIATNIGSTVYPAAWDEVIGVGGVDLDEDGTPKSSLWYLRGPAVDFCARADCGSDHGTSYAVPRVAAIVADYLQSGGNAEGTADYLRAQAVDLGDAGYDTTYGWGYLTSD